MEKLSGHVSCVISDCESASDDISDYAESSDSYVSDSESEESSDEPYHWSLFK